MKTFIKNSLITLAVFIATVLPVTSLNSAPVSAAARAGDDCLFLGLTSWDCGVDTTVFENNSGTTGEDKIKTIIWTIVANVSVDLTVIAAYLIIGYVIYGGYLYIFSGGEAGKIATGKKALTQAFIGLAIVMSANLIMNTIRIALFNNSGAFKDCVTTECVQSADLVANLIQWFIGIAGLISLIFVVLGGIKYISSNGDAGKVESAKRTILYSLIGLAIVALAEIITSFVATTIRNANSGTSVINETIISKEVLYNHENKV